MCVFVGERERERETERDSVEQFILGGYIQLVRGFILCLLRMLCPLFSPHKVSYSLGVDYVIPS